MSRRKILVADLLCGAGGSSTGCARAMRELGLQIGNAVSVRKMKACVLAIMADAAVRPETVAARKEAAA